MVATEATGLMSAAVAAPTAASNPIRAREPIRACFITASLSSLTRCFTDAIPAGAADRRPCWDDSSVLRDEALRALRGLRSRNLGKVSQPRRRAAQRALEGGAQRLALVVGPGVVGPRDRGVRLELRQRPARRRARDDRPLRRGVIHGPVEI